MRFAPVSSAALLACGLLAALAPAAPAGFIFANADRPDSVTFAAGYDGTGGRLDISVGILSSSPFANDIVVSTRNVVNTFNRLQASENNLSFDFSTIPSGAFDFESVLLHEVGHSMGLAHVNLASESGLGGSNRNYTKSTVGADGNFNLNAGVDGVIGSRDDLRGDDVNLTYFNRVTNDPFDTTLVNDPNAIIDSTTYSRDVNDLPVGDNYAANGDRNVAELYGYDPSSVEAVMQQGQFNNEIQRELGAQDVAHLRYAQSGLDGLQNTADDYTFELNYAGLVADEDGADIVLEFDSEAGFAFSRNSGFGFSGSDDITINPLGIVFNPNTNWFFNQVSNDDPAAVPEPATVGLVGAALLGAVGYRRRRVAAERA